MRYKMKSSSAFHILETIPKRRRWDRGGFREFLGKVGFDIIDYYLYNLFS